jgi:hypothetical protein
VKLRESVITDVWSEAARYLADRMRKYGTLPLKQDSSEEAMRSTKASAAVTRLNARDTSNRYSMGMTASGFFYLLRAVPGGAPERISEDLTLEEFVEFANKTGPQKKVKVSKFDVAFEKQLAGKYTDK